jgi:TonB-dependent receptor
VAFDVTLPFSPWAELDAKAKAGAMMVDRDREVATRRFNFSARGDLGGDRDLPRLAPEDLFSPALIGENMWQFQELTLPTDYYTAAQDIIAGYGLVEFPVTSSLDLMGGARIERSDQVVETFEPFQSDADVIRASLDKTDLLPASTLTWRFTDEMQARLGYSRTVSRPDFRELSPSIFIDTTENKQYVGNPELKRTRLDHFDSRWEYYFSTDETFSIGGFYKRLENPIEEVIQPAAGLSITWQNAESANNWGLEFEGRKNLGFADAMLQNVFASLNVSFINSTINFDPEQAQNLTSKERPLQGQSPYVVNAQLSYDTLVDEDGLSATILYNVSGRRISAVGSNGLPDIYEEPFHQLDFVYTQKLGDHFRVGAKAKNIFDPRARWTQSGNIQQAERKGRDFSVGLSYNY